ncbi:MAG: metal ABC transporter permease [Actinomycetales bacterium]|nr:metal ABC transporter permease [Actinomycetales bacterium]
MTSIVSDWQWSYDGWIIVVTSLVAVVCAIPGSFLLVRRQAMLGDAVAHAVLPGIAIGFLVSGSRGGGWMLTGAILAGLATALLTQLLRGIAGVDRGAALGVVFSTLFALGLVLIVRVADSVDLDPACVLYGQVELVPLDLVEIAGFKVPRAVPWLLAVLLVMSLIVGMLWKELLISSFDKAAADAQGISSAGLNQVLMAIVATACVVAFEAVGSILVVSFLISPPAAARLLTGRFFGVVFVAMLFGLITAAAGHLAAVSLPDYLGFGGAAFSTAGSTACVSVLLVILGMALRWREVSGNRSRV